ncbi:MAG TPA: glycosyltransferase family 4 protein [Terriglobales bacterium]|nr:glycosyltransferase family 4 protein [Terriglobales bacterium]
MKVLLLNQAFYPDVVSSAQHAADLAASLVEAGHEVTVVADTRSYDDRAWRFPRGENWRGVRITRVPSTGFGKAARWRRAADFFSFMLSCALRLIFLPRFDVVIAMTSPPLILLLAALAVPLKARKLLFWSMDLNPDEAIAAGWLRPHSIPARLLGRLMLYSLKRAERIVALDRFMRDRICAKGIAGEKIAVVPPWAHDDRVCFDADGRQRFRNHHGLSEKFVVMYSGNHSPCHPLDTLLAAAERLADHAEIVFLFVGGGSEFRKPLAIEQRGTPNIRCLPYRPAEELAGSLSAADLHVVIMGSAFVGIVHPCKVYNILAVGAPFLYIGPQETHIADLIARLQDSGSALVAGHGEVESVIRGILEAAQRRSMDRSCPREFAGQFSRQVLVPQMIHVLETMTPTSCVTTAARVSQPHHSP